MFAFQANPLNRHGDIRHQESFIEPLISAEETLYLPVFKQSIVSQTHEDNLKKNHEPCWLSYQELLLVFGQIEKKHLIYLGERDSKHYFTFRLKTENSIAQIEQNTGYSNLELKNLRLLFKTLSPDHAHLCNVAIAMEHWHNTHQYCGYCGHQTYSAQAGFLRVCSNTDCQTQQFPRTDSAVICAITYQDKILLGRQESWPEKQYSVIAGFVEPGETLEQAVAREAYEETGIDLTNIRYYQSQPWPFPQSLMVGFTAEATNHTIKLLDDELEQAQWFSREEVVQAVEQQKLFLPFKYSISRELINQWIRKES